MFVMPANAGIQVRFQFTIKNRLDSAGMTGARVDFQSTNSEPLGLEPRVDQFNLRLNLIFPLGRIASVVNLTFPYYRPRDP
jgi:hypothetical protein